MANVNLIKSSISEACAYARYNDPKAIQAAGIFLREGKTIPQASLLHQSDAVRKTSCEISKEAANKNKSLIGLAKEIFKFAKNLVFAFKNKENKTAYKEFINEFEMQYPKTKNIRRKIMNKQGKESSRPAIQSFEDYMRNIN